MLRTTYRVNNKCLEVLLMKLYPKNFSTAVHNCNLSGISLSRYFLDIEIVLNETTEDEILRQMEKNLSVMEKAAAKGIAGVTLFRFDGRRRETSGCIPCYGFAFRGQPLSRGNDSVARGQ